METLVHLQRRTVCVGSYRTYEEWKPEIGSFVVTWKPGSYRTYEEWKHADYWTYLIDRFGSYRTYEEWKQNPFVKDE